MGLGQPPPETSNAGRVDNHSWRCSDARGELEAVHWRKSAFTDHSLLEFRVVQSSGRQIASFKAELSQGRDGMAYV